MQEFNITGKTTITAEIKAQVDDSPIVVPPKEGVADENIQPLVEVTSDTIDLLNNTNQIINNFDNNLNHTTDVFRAMNEVVTKTTQNLANYGTNKTNSSLLALPPPEGTDGQTILIPQQETQLDEIDNQNIIDQQNQDVETPITRTIPTPEETQTMQPLVDSVDTTTESMKSNNIMLKEFGEFLPVLLKNFQSMNDAVARTNQNLPAIGHVVTSEEKKKKQLDEYNRQNFMQLVTTGSNTVQSVANGNVAGAVIGGVNQVANTSNNLSKMADTADMAGLAKTLVAGGVIATVAGLALKGADTLSEKYIEEMPTIYGTGKSFGSMDDTKAMRYWEEINQYNKGTGLDIDTFQEIAQSLRKQGVGNDALDKTSVVGNIAQTTSQWAYATGGDVQQYAQLAGIMSRYGGSKNVSEDFNEIVNKGYASGLQDTQIPEFLSSIQKVMEEGIAKGFSRSATEVADTLLMFSKMSGNNAFWQGEQGAKILNQANSGIAGSTSMSKTEDIVVFKAFQDAYSGETIDKKGNKVDKKKAALGDTYVDGGGYVNTMQLIEKGLNQDNFSSIMESLEKAYGKDNKEAQIEALRNMTGLNYTGAARLLNLDRNADTTTIENVINAPENKNNETRYQEAVNDIKTTVIRIGNKTAELKIAGMETLSGTVKSIADKYLGNSAADLSVPLGESAENVKEVEKVHNVGEKQVHWGFSLASIGDDALGGWKASEGPVWKLQEKKIDKQSIIDLLRTDVFGTKVKEMTGSEDEANAFYKYLFDVPNQNVDDFMGDVSFKANDYYLYQGERNEILKKLDTMINEFKEITLTENR